MKITSSKSFVLRSGMTLLEIVVVIGIIAVILGASITYFAGFKEGANQVAAKKHLTSISALLESYNLTSGTYPTESQGLKALVEKPNNSPVPSNWTKQIQQLPTDPWGNEYVYKRPGTIDPSTYEIISKGGDGVLGGDDDISSQNLN